MRSKFNPDISEFVAIYDELKSSRKVGEYFNVDKTTILNFAHKIGYDVTSKPILSKDAIKFVCDNYDELTSVDLSKMFNCSRSYIAKIWSENNLHGKTTYTYTYNVNYFENIDSRDKAYFVGFLASDGNVSIRNNGQQNIIRLQLQKCDLEILEKFNKYTESNKPINTFKGHCILEFSSDKMYRDLGKVKITPRKTYKDVIPDIKDELKIDFIRGYFDGDGSISYSNNDIRQCHISFSGFKNNLNGLKEWLEGYNIFTSYVADKRKHRYGGRDFGSLSFTNSNNKYCFLKLIYENCDDLYMERKFRLANKYISQIESSKTIRDREAVLYYNKIVLPTYKEVV